MNYSKKSVFNALVLSSLFCASSMYAMEKEQIEDRDVQEIESLSFDEKIDLNELVSQLFDKDYFPAELRKNIILLTTEAAFRHDFKNSVVLCDLKKPILSMQSSPDGSELLAVVFDDYYKLYRLNAFTGEIIQEIGDPAQARISAVYSPKKDTIIALRKDGKIEILTSYNGKYEASLTIKNDAVISSLAVSLDGNYILGGDRNGNAYIWDAGTGELSKKLTGYHNHIIRLVAFSPCGKFALTGSDDKTICLWDTALGTNLHQFKEYDKSLYTSVSFSPDCSYILASNDGGFARVWERDSRNVVSFCFAPRKKNTALSMKSALFSADEKCIITGLSNGVIKLWDISDGAKAITEVKVSDSAVSRLARNSHQDILIGSGDGKIYLMKNLQAPEKWENEVLVKRDKTFFSSLYCLLAELHMQGNSQNDSSNQ